MERIELMIKKKAAKLISFLKKRYGLLDNICRELDFVEVKQIKRKKSTSSKNLDDIIIPAINP